MLNACVMMPARIEKLEACAAILLDGFINLREKYAMLEPMLFNAEVVESRGSQVQTRGFTLLKNVLFLGCAQDIAKLSLDKDKRSPSIWNIVCALVEDPLLRDQLRMRYSSVWRDPLSDIESDPKVLIAIKQMELHEKAKLQEQFDEHYKRLMALWESMCDSPILNAFLKIRHKVSAHTDVRFEDGEYKLLDINTLGITWKNMRETICTMQDVVILLGFIVRNACFNWDLLDQQLSKAASGFWISGRNPTP